MSIGRAFNLDNVSIDLRTLTNKPKNDEYNYEYLLKFYRLHQNKKAIEKTKPLDTSEPTKLIPEPVTEKVA